MTRLLTLLLLTAGPAAAEPANSYRATGVGIVSASVAPAAGADKEFFRLTVR